MTLARKAVHCTAFARAACRFCPLQREAAQVSSAGLSISIHERNPIFQAGLVRHLSKNEHQRESPANDMQIVGERDAWEPGWHVDGDSGVRHGRRKMVGITRLIAIEKRRW
jgi:hypothetical protein